MALEYASPNIVLGAGRFFIDRYEENGGVRGAEQYIGDTVGATLTATVETQQIFSGDGAVATKLIDKVTQVDRSMGITPQDASLNNMALFLIAAKPAEGGSAVAAASVTAEFKAPSDVSDRHYFPIGTGTIAAPNPASRFGVTLGDGNKWVVTVGTESSTINTATEITNSAQDGIEFGDGMVRFTKASVLAAIKGKYVKVVGSKVVLPAFNRVMADDNTKQVRVAVRYLEDADEGVNARNIYIPQASVSPAGEAALKSRDTPQQFPLTLGIEQPDGDLAQVYVDGVGF